MQIAPYIGKLSEENPDVKFVNIDTGDMDGLAKEHGLVC